MKSACLLLLFPVHAAAQNAGPNRLSPLERDAGWELLFDGETTSGWRQVSAPGFPSDGWDVHEGALHHTSGGGDIVTERLFDEFELEFEWKVSAGANSGVKYMLPQQDAARAYGPEYQVLDDDMHPDVSIESHRAGSLYDIHAATNTTLAPVGEFNRGRIVVYDGRIEHWLNGARVVNVDTRSEDFVAAFEASKYKQSPNFARSGRGRISLQDHGDEVWFRSLRIRELPAARFEQVDLLAEDNLDSWSLYGDARYTRTDRTILGEVTGGAQSFLLTEQSFGDFIFEVDVKTELPGNSGIQIRSHQQESGRPFGYQIEIDPSPRSWTGGLYDELRRGWLQNLEQNDAGRTAFVFNEWNRFRIECVGPWIRASVNGIPTADYFDVADIEGVFGLQVHSGNNTRVRWRDPRVWELGRRHWQAAEFKLPGAPVTSSHDADRVSILHAAGEPFTIDLPPSLSADALTARFSVHSPNRVSLVVGSWSHVFSEASSFNAVEWNDFGVCRDGERLTLILNGRPLALKGLAELGEHPLQIRFSGGPSADRVRGLEVLRRR